MLAKKKSKEVCERQAPLDSFGYTTTFFFYLFSASYNKIPSKWKIVKIFFFCLLPKIYKHHHDGGGKQDREHEMEEKKGIYLI
jgi:hypothetical protein